MKRRTLLALALALAFLAGTASAQDSADAPKKEPTPTPAQLEEMKRALEAQQQQIERLRQEAAERDKALEQMQKQVQDQLQQTEAAAVAAAQAAEAAKTQQRHAMEDQNLDKPGVYKASLSPSLAAMLQQPNPATQVVTPPWAVLKIADNVVFRFGSVLQPTYEALQDPNSKGYSQNLYLRRARFNVLANLPENVTVFFQTDDPRLGYASNNGQKNINSGFLIQDAYAQWNFLGNAMAIQGGEFLVPTNRQVMTSVATFLALDLPTWSQQQGTILEQNGGRDYGVGLNGALLDNRLTYRTGVFSGWRAPTSSQPPPLGPAAGSRNPLYFAGRLQYDFFDTEYVYSYPGTNLGKKKMVAIAGWGQGQGAYKGYGGDVFVDWPVNNGDAVTAEADYMHYDGHGFVFNDNGTNNTLPNQYTIYTNAGYYFHHLKLQPFVRYEILHYDDDLVNLAKGQQRVGGGFNYYVYGQNFKIVPYYERIIAKSQPATAQIKDFNRFVVEMQGSF